ncbi:MAG: cyclase family protein [Betaproteobacteria bacterium]|nr:cyclase family protein [Betaproteobacteria bacterium]
MRSFERILPYWPHRTYNWGRWSNDRGTLNLLDPGTTQRAIASVSTFETLALGAPLRADDAGLDAHAFSLDMLHAGKYDFGPTTEPVQAAGDRVCVSIHGMTNSHIDALCHAGHRGRSFNDSEFAVNVERGQPARRLTIMEMPTVVTRAWFVDVPRRRGVKALRPGTPVVPEDLAWLDGQVEPGDAVVVRTGRYATRVVRPDDPEAGDDHGNWSGLHVDCMEQVAAWELSTVATDSSGDNFPSTTSECSVPIHVLTEVYLGLPLLHHLDLEELGRRMQGRAGSAFMLIVAPLRVIGGTGSPVSPVAVI